MLDLWVKREEIEVDIPQLGVDLLALVYLGAVLAIGPSLVNLCLRLSILRLVLLVFDLNILFFDHVCRLLLHLRQSRLDVLQAIFGRRLLLLLWKHGIKLLGDVYHWLRLLHLFII